VDRAERTNGVPFYPHPTTELYVDLLRDEKTLFAGFQAVARRNIRRAREAGYVISVDYEPHALKKAWPAFQSRSLQKGIRYRQLETYERIMCEAKPYRASHLYTAWLKGVPMAAILVLRDCTTAHYFLGTIDADALGDAPSPACLLHWAAMREAADMGCSYYNLGTRSGTVYTFKAKFRPVEHERPSPVTLAIKPRLYQLWRRLLPAVTQAVV
jgi:lipid II:glycine glycyltransferase (peptidoglycan interpeptide bridge formation enzyme)